MSGNGKGNEREWNTSTACDMSADSRGGRVLDWKLEDSESAQTAAFPLRLYLHLVLPALHVLFVVQTIAY